MNNQQQYQNPYSDEIDLVDLAAVLYRRKIMFIFVLIICTVLGFGYWATMTESMETTAVFQTGKIAVIENGEALFLPLMNSDTSEQLLESIFIPLAIDTTDATAGKRLNQDNIVNDQESKTLLLTTNTSKDDSKIARAVLSESFDLLLEVHNEEYRSFIQNIQDKIDSELTQIEELSINLKSGAPTQYVMERRSIILSLKTILAASMQSKIIKQPTSVTIESKRPNLFVMGGFVAGLFVGCFVVFFQELYAKAKIRATEIADV